MDFLSGELLLVDKPKHWTSFDVVNKIRYALRKKLNVKNIKVGHAGTLDPLATGLLLICTGKRTKDIAELQGMSKEYTGRIQLGATTASYDEETPIHEVFPLEELNETQLRQTAQKMIGEQDQLPPIFSAIKVDGRPLYKAARKGEEVEVQPRRITIHDFRLTEIALPYVDFWVSCSKGTYIRSLAYDFGRNLANGGFLKELRRTKIGAYSVDDAWELEKLIAMIQG